MADGGTAFFDEIGDLPLEMQVKLLRLVQERQFRAVGALEWRPVDLRVIAATHRSLRTEVGRGRFREDLYYRLNVFAIHLPPLRTRAGDIPLLVNHFLEATRAAGLPWFNPGSSTLAELMSYDWPGNVRELKNAVERMAAMYSEGSAEPDLPSAVANRRAEGRLDPMVPVDAPLAGDFYHAPVSPVISIPESEKQAIERALAASQGEREPAARMLGIGRTTLYRKMKKYALN
jgi:DNA-binding NtrC family response regulator